jgi:Protein of unknown function (DUF2937)
MPASPLLRPFASAAERLVDRALCVAGAVAASQLPEFMQQYLQRLEGHLDEARIALSRFSLAASQSGLSLDQFADAAARNPDPAMARMAGVIREAAQRVDALDAADQALRHAGAWSRPLVFLSHLDPGIARATWALFRPAVPTTAEGLVYAVLGMAAALAVYHLALRSLAARLWPRKGA